jgi:hypothetical protein
MSRTATELKIGLGSGRARGGERIQSVMRRTSRSHDAMQAAILLDL